MSNTKLIPHCGIDFGTTNSSLAVSQGSNPKVIPIDRQNKNPYVLRSLIYINPAQSVAIGSEAISRYLSDLNTLPTVPLRQEFTGRMIKTFGPSSGGGAGPVIWVPEIVEIDDSGRGRLLQSLKSVLTSSFFSGTNIFGKFYSLEDLLSLLLLEIKTRAESELGYELTSAIIGRPVRYVGTDASQTALDRMSRIGKSAGFKNVEFEYEPVGAALNYGLDVSADQKVLVYDFGGGTLDVCIMKFPEKEILAVSGRGVGGDLLDTRLIQSKLLHHFGSTAIINNKIPLPKHFLAAFNSWYQTTLQKNVSNLNLLEDLAIKSDQPDSIRNLISLISNDYGFEFFKTVDDLKIALSTSEKRAFNFDRPKLKIEESLTRSDFENSVTEELLESKNCIFEALTQANLTPSDIDRVILTGGSSQTPIFVDQVKNIFTSEKIVTSDHFTSVTLGLSLRAQIIFS